MFSSQETHKGFKVFYPKSIKELRSWLEQYGEIEKSVWILIYKKHTKLPSLTAGEIVKHALCFGWVDSKTNKKDDDSYYMYISRRNPKSNWSAVNKSNITNLEKEGLLHDTGKALIKLAKETGTWDALNDVDNLVIPPDLEKAFKKHVGSKDNFIAFNRSTKRATLEWIFNAKKAETRANRIHKTAHLAAQNIKAF